MNADDRANPRFCSRCGGVLSTEFIDGRNRQHCKACGNVAYVNPLPCVAAMLTLNDRFCLVKRNVEPGYGKWGLPAGFMEWGETPEASLRREVLEETGLECSPPRLVTVVSEIIQPYGHVVILGFHATAASADTSPGDDASEAEFFDFNDHPPLAFITHREIFREFIERYRHSNEAATKH